MTPAEKSGPAPWTRRFSAWSGLDALASLWPAASEPIPYPHRDEAAALRGDFFRIGNDLRGVIEREVSRGSVKQD
jgi:hypothetical protein